MKVELITPRSPWGEPIGPHEVHVDGVLVGLSNDASAAVWLFDECHDDRELAQMLRDNFEIRKAG